MGEMINTAARGNQYHHRDYYASASRESYDVFLSFIGEDTRHNITSDLYHALEERGILTFKDDDKKDIYEISGSLYPRSGKAFFSAIHRYSEISDSLYDPRSEQALFSAIHRSKIFIIIFSQRYADDRWCLLQLAEIVKRMQEKEGNRGGGGGGEIIVLPVFYDMSPSDVRNQTGRFESAFQRHQERRFDTKRVEGWEKALRMVSKLRGWYIQGFNGHERMECIKVIADTVFYDLENIKMRSRFTYTETTTMGFSASRGNTDFGWYTLNGFCFVATSKVCRPFHVFINHRGPDTKHGIADLLYDRLSCRGLNPFLDEKSMMLGEELHELIEIAMEECTVGVAIISPNYCNSKNCLHELATLMKYNKKMIPIFFDIKVSDLTVESDGNFSDEQLDRFSCALKFIKGKKGIEFDSKEEFWSDMLNEVVTRVTDMINYPPHRLFSQFQRLSSYTDVGASANVNNGYLH